MSRIIPPALRHLSISFFSQLIIDIPRLCLFIGLVDALSSPTEVTVELCPGCALVFLNRRGQRGSSLGKLAASLLDILQASSTGGYLL